jgi:hypothetical protein
VSVAIVIRASVVVAIGALASCTQAAKPAAPAHQTPVEAPAPPVPAASELPPVAAVAHERSGARDCIDAVLEELMARKIGPLMQQHVAQLAAPSTAGGAPTPTP